MNLYVFFLSMWTSAFVVVFGRKGGQSRGWNLVPWKETIRPKADGGLGIRSTRNNNVAMFGGEPPPWTAQALGASYFSEISE